MYIAGARAHFKINTHGCWNWHLWIPDGLSVVQCSLGHVIWDCVFRHNFSGMKRMCWTTGIWRRCLSLEVVRSIPDGSTITCRFLCGFICFSLCQSIKIKPTNTSVQWWYGQGGYYLMTWRTNANKLHLKFKIQGWPKQGQRTRNSIWYFSWRIHSVMGQTCRP